MKLIAKDPLNRYQTVTGIIADLKNYQRLRTEAHEDPDFEIARSDRAGKLNFTTSLIGRDKELGVLQNLIGQAKATRGSIAFVNGEAGVGKSRLINELRGYVHSIGGMFVGAKANQYGSSIPYRVFSESLAAYVEKLKRTSKQERKAAVKRMSDALGELGGEVIKIAPSIVDLIGKQPELVGLAPEKEKARFLIAVTKFILSLGATECPLVLFLDDLQWANEGSIGLLGLIAERVHYHSVVVIASYRDTDVDDQHPLLKTVRRLQDINIPLVRMHVKPLNVEDTARIVSEILLEEPADLLPLAKECQKRTGGNAFFVLELLHSLVDEKIVYLEDDHYRFDMEKLKASALPTNVVDVIVRRIDDVAAENQRVLAFASIMGREIDFERLSDLSPIPRERVLDALEEGIKNQFLVRDIKGTEKVFFIHDQIQEAFYIRVPEREKIALHGQLARLIEEMNRDNVEPVLFELAHHFAQAKILEKTLLYSMQAGKEAQAAYANHQAIKLYNQAKSILERQGATKTDEYIDLLENLGAAYYQAGKYDEASKTLRECISLIPKEDNLRKAGVLSKTGDTLQKKGELEDCEKVLVEALKLLGIRLPNNIVFVFLGIIKQLVVHGIHSAFPGIFVRKEYSNDPKAEVVAHVLCRLFYLYYFSDLIKGAYVLLKAQNIAEKRLGPSRRLCQIVSISGMAWMQCGWSWWARRHARLADKIAVDLNDKAYTGLSSAFHAWVEHPYSARQSVQLGHKAVELLKRVGEYWDLGHASCCLLWGEQKTGKNLNELVEANKGQIALMQSINAPQNLGWALGQEGLLLAYIGDKRLKSKAIKTLEKSIILLKRVNDKPWVLCAVGYLAYAHLRARNYEEAIRQADWVAKRFLSDHLLTTWLLDIVGMCAQVYLHTVMNKPDLSKAERKKYLKKARYFYILACLKGWMYPTYRGWAYLVGGTYHWLIENRAKAVQTWEQGMTYLREHTQDTYRLACILLEEASFLLKENPNNKKAQEYLSEAKEIFTQVDATLDLEKTNQLLKASSAEKEVVEYRHILTLKRQIESLLSVTKTIGSVFDPKELLDKIIDQAMKVTGAERGFLLLYDEEDMTLRQEMSRGVDDPVNAGGDFSLENSNISLEMVQEVEKTGEGLIEGQDGVSFPKISAELTRYNVKEALCVPLKAMDKPLGIIYLDNRMATGIFGLDELDLMNSFAVQAAISYENATLFSQTMTLNEELQRRIKELEQAEHDKERLQSQLLQAQKLEAIGTLTGGIAHDFNNILQAISGYVELLSNRVTGDDRSSNYLSQIQITTQRASDLVKRLLAFSRRIDSELKPVDLNDEVIRAGNLLQRMIPKMIAIEFDLADDLELINADPIQLEQVMMNLGVNAKDAMPGEGRLTFATRNVTLDELYCKNNVEAVPGRYVLLSVYDTGHGMDKQTMERIFDPFYSTKEIGKGTGLGLAVSYGIVKTHGGHIKCYSEPGHGTVFKIYLPALKTVETKVKAVLKHDPKIVGGRETILLVDDMENLLDLGKDLLEQYGYSVVTAESGEKAIDVYKQQMAEINLVILDIGMPGMGGLECLKELLKIDPAINVLVASGYVDSINKTDLFDYGAAGFISKPYRQADILSAVRDILDAGERRISE